MSGRAYRQGVSEITQCRPRIVHQPLEPDVQYGFWSERMHLSVKALTIALGLLWGGLLVVGLANLNKGAIKRNIPIGEDPVAVA